MGVPVTTKIIIKTMNIINKGILRFVMSMVITSVMFVITESSNADNNLQKIGFFTDYAEQVGKKPIVGLPRPVDTYRTIASGLRYIGSLDNNSVYEQLVKTPFQSDAIEHLQQLILKGIRKHRRAELDGVGTAGELQRRQGSTPADDYFNQEIYNQYLEKVKSGYQFPNNHDGDSTRNARYKGFDLAETSQYALDVLPPQVRQRQREYVAGVLNIPVKKVTDQHIIAFGKMSSDAVNSYMDSEQTIYLFDKILPDGRALVNPITKDGALSNIMSDSFYNTSEHNSLLEYARAMTDYDEELFHTDGMFGRGVVKAKHYAKLAIDGVPKIIGSSLARVSFLMGGTSVAKDIQESQIVREGFFWEKFSGVNQLNYQNKLKDNLKTDNDILRFIKNIYASVSSGIAVEMLASSAAGIAIVFWLLSILLRKARDIW